MQSVKSGDKRYNRAFMRRAGLSTVQSGQPPQGSRPPKALYSLCLRVYGSSQMSWAHDWEMFPGGEGHSLAKWSAEWRFKGLKNSSRNHWCLDCFLCYTSFSIAPTLICRGELLYLASVLWQLWGFILPLPRANKHSQLSLNKEIKMMIIMLNLT